jgi:hypothetical protein
LGPGRIGRGEGVERFGCCADSFEELIEAGGKVFVVLVDLFSFQKGVGVVVGDR